MMFFGKKINLSGFTDTDLIERFRHSHDNRYIGQLYLNYSHLVLGVCFKYFKNEDKAKDAMMSIFEEIIPKLKRHKVENFKSWLYSVSKNHCLQKIRKDKSEFNKSSAFEIFNSNSVESDNEIHLLEKAEKEKLFLKLEEFLPSLKEGQSKCLKMFYLDEKSYAQIVEESEYSLKEVKSYIQNGKRNLKKMLTE